MAEETEGGRLVEDLLQTLVQTVIWAIWAYLAIIGLIVVAVVGVVVWAIRGER